MWSRTRRENPVTRSEFIAKVEAGGESRQEACRWLGSEWFDTWELTDLQAHIAQFHAGDYQGCAGYGIFPFFLLGDRHLIEEADQVVTWEESNG